MDKTDARVRYTKMVIEKSFYKLLKEKPVNKITVTELCNLAMINRATFYKYYLDILDLLDKIEEEIFDEIKSTFNKREVPLKDFLDRMLTYTYNEKEKFLALGSKNGDPNLMMKTFNVCYQSAYPLFKKSNLYMKENELELFYNFLSYGSVGIVAKWFELGMNEKPEEISNFILNICTIASHATEKKNWRFEYKE